MSGRAARLVLDLAPRTAAHRALVASFLAPLLFYVPTLSGAGYWLDGDEFVAVGATLGISHPPGHPLYAVLTRAVQLVPLGDLAFRTALGSALALAVASVLLCGVALSLFARLGEAGAGGALCAFGAAACASLMQPSWFQAVRPEVYALASLAAAAVLYSLASGRLVLAAFAFGLGLANHHLVAILSALSLVPLLRLQAPLRRARLVWSIAALGAPLALYAYLPLRSLQPEAFAVGLARTPAEFSWIVAARAYQHSAALSTSGPFANVIDLVFALGPAGLVTLALAIGGLYALGRSGERRWAIALGASVALPFALRAGLGFVRHNPDALGYLAPATGAIALLAACLFAVARRTPGLARPIGGALLGVPLVLALVHAKQTAKDCDLSSFRANEAVHAAVLQDVAPRSVLLVSWYQTYFGLAAEASTARTRPDLRIVPLPFLASPGVAERLVALDPDLRGIVRTALLSDTSYPTVFELSELAARRGVRVDPDPYRGAAAFAHLVPAGPLAVFSPEPVDPTTMRTALPRHLARWDALLAEVGLGGAGVGAGRAIAPVGSSAETEPAEQSAMALLWPLVLDALHLAARGERGGAAHLLALAAPLDPQARGLDRLREELLRGGGPVDIEPYLPR